MMSIPELSRKAAKIFNSERFLALPARDRIAFRKQIERAMESGASFPSLPFRSDYNNVIPIEEVN